MSEFYYTLAALLLGLIVYQGIKKSVDLVSHRNIYLAGFIYFQIIGLATLLPTEDFRPVRLNNPRQALELYFWYTLVYLVCFFLAYHKNPISARIARFFRPRRPYVANDWLLMMVALVFLALGVFLRYFARHVGLGLLAGFVPAFPAACAIVAWIWGGRRFNLFVVSVGGFIFAVSAFATVWGVFGRRPLLQVCLAVVWGAYYRMRDRLPMTKIVLWSVPIVLVSIHLLGAMTMHRGKMRSAADVGAQRAIMTRILTTSPIESYSAYFEGNNDAKFTLWALDAYPDVEKRRHLYTFYFMLIHPIPGSLWPDKPSPLSSHVASLADIEGVHHATITIPPGVLGYAAAEGGWYALILYGLFFGVFVRFFDEIARQNPGNPFLILSVGCTLGQVIGLARGDIAIFANLITLGFLAVWGIMLLSRYLIGKRIPHPPIMYQAPPHQRFVR